MKSHRFFIFIAIGIASVIFTVALYAARVDFFNSLDLKLKDVRFRARGNVEPDKRVVIVAIDEKSINELGRWPWDRKTIARLVENLNFYGAKTIVFDVIFSEPSNEVSDKALSDAILKSNNVILGYFMRSEGEPPLKESLALLEDTRIKIVKTTGNVTEVPVYSFPSIELNIPIIAKSAHGAGYFNIIPDSDGILRSVNILMLYDGNIYPSLALSALRHYTGSEIVLEIANYGVDNLLIGSYRIPCDESGRLTLNYYGKQGTFRTIPAVDIIKKRLKHDELKDSLVFIGATEIGLSDLRATPVDPVLPGIEVHATVVSNALQNKLLIKDGRVIALDILFIIIFALMLTTSLSLVRRTLAALILFLAVLGLYYITNHLVFKHYPLNTSVLFPLISITLSYFGSEAYRNLFEERQSRFLKKAFSSYVSPELVSEIMKRPDMLKLGGEKREITVLFSDIRGFTTLSERLTPESLVSVLNQYLSPMTDIVLKNKGTLDKYIGDAIMAIYNAPLNIHDHAALACKSAIEMLERLKDINNSFKEKGLPEIDIGVGINTGEVIVGNMGTDMRFDYTAIGDTVNLASRLEGMNKVYKTHIIISEFTFRYLTRLNDLTHKVIVQHSLNSSTLYIRELDMIKVKGKDKPVTIYQVSSDMDEVLIDKFEGALQLYRKQQFKEAREVFEMLEAEYSDKTAGVFAERCAEFINNPPGDNWEGVYVAKIK
ncbi:adenylate/guanylate cyclase domain-containing protein [hot springs metagenome]|uniref:Adenylate/guanylate cyclase domain-containing protein n=1 Tax=hot springs metagenome TaxID=433727 RepID=A0A5J4L0V3_9ZZZZ